MDISDITVLPNTIKPSPGDYLLIVLPNTIEFLFRVNSFSYNTIQSNDFYTFSADLKHTGSNLIDKIKDQVVEEYETIFENIGTKDKCFILKTDVSKIQNIGKLFLEMRDAYYISFFDTETGTFVCKNNTETSYFNDAWLYDKYINKFIMDSEIYYTENDAKSVVVSCCDIRPDEMRLLYMQTLPYAVLNNTISYLMDYPYYYQVDNESVLSPFIINHLNCKGVNLVITRKELVDGQSNGLDSDMLHEYYSHELISKIKYPNIDEDIEDDNSNMEDVEIDKDIETTPEDDNNDIVDISDEMDDIVNEEDNSTSEDENGDVEDDNSDMDDVETIPDTTNETYLDKIIYQWLTNQTLEIDKNEIIPYMLRVDNYTYRMIPLVMYVIMKYYDSYFKITEL